MKNGLIILCALALAFWYASGGMAASFYDLLKWAATAGLQ